MRNSGNIERAQFWIRAYRAEMRVLSHLLVRRIFLQLLRMNHRVVGCQTGPVETLLHNPYLCLRLGVDRW